MMTNQTHYLLFPGLFVAFKQVNQVLGRALFRNPITASEAKESYSFSLKHSIVLPPFQIICRFNFSRGIVFAIHLDVHV